MCGPPPACSSYFSISLSLKFVNKHTSIAPYMLSQFACMCHMPMSSKAFYRVRYVTTYTPAPSSFFLSPLKPPDAFPFFFSALAPELLDVFPLIISPFVVL